jgi:hypothetical protein
MCCLLAGHETMRRLPTAPLDIHDAELEGYERASENDNIAHIPQFPRAVSGNFACPAIPGYFGPDGDLPVTGAT